MKITVESAKGFLNGVTHDIYLDEELKGWLGMFGKLKIKNVEAGEHTITIKSYDRTSGRKRSIRFTAEQNVHIWIRENIIEGTDCFSILTMGEDVKIIEETKETKEPGKSVFIQKWKKRLDDWT